MTIFTIGTVALLPRFLKKLNTWQNTQVSQSGSLHLTHVPQGVPANFFFCWCCGGLPISAVLVAHFFPSGLENFLSLNSWVELDLVFAGWDMVTSGLGVVATVVVSFVLLVAVPGLGGSGFFIMKISLTAGFVFCSLAAWAGFSLGFSFSWGEEVDFTTFGISFSDISTTKPKQTVKMTRTFNFAFQIDGIDFNWH